MELGIDIGIWKIIQDRDDLTVRLFQYGREVDSWDGEKQYSFEELYEMLLQKSYERREKNGNIPEQDMG